MNRAASILSTDVVLLLLYIFMILPMQPDVASESEAHIEPLVVRIEWCDMCRTDVDLWFKTPGDDPVGYSRKQGRYASLERDDLGHEETPIRYEQAKARVVPSGEYIANVHLYKDMGGNAPVKVRLSIWLKQPGSTEHVALWQGHVTLVAPGDEITVVRWTIAEGRLVPGSIHYTQAELRRAGAEIP